MRRADATARVASAVRIANREIGVPRLGIQRQGCSRDVPAARPEGYATKSGAAHVRAVIRLRVNSLARDLSRELPGRNCGDGCPVHRAPYFARRTVKTLAKGYQSA